MVEPRILYSDEDRVIAAIDALVVLVAARPAAATHVHLIEEAMRDLAVARPEGIGYVHVVDSRAGESRKLSDEARKAFVEFARNPPREARAVAIVMLAEGFVAAAMRGVVAAAVKAMPVALPMKVFGSIEDASAWLEKTLREAKARVVPGADLARALHKARDLVPSRRDAVDARR